MAYYPPASSGTITAGTTVTSGITSTHILSSTGNLVVDSGIVVSNVPLLNAATNTFTGTVATSSGNNITSGGYVLAAGNVYCGAVLNFNTAGVNSIISSPTNGILQFGAADAAAPVATKFTVQNVVAGTTNTAGVDFTIAGSQGTGTGIGGRIIIQTAPAGTTGTAQNALTNAMVFKAGTAILTSYTVANLPAAATVGAGATAFVTDASTTLVLGLGGAVAGGGANKVPVYSDGTNWLYG